mgnify:CR=1 FL=1|jgi:hypothetical protein
MEGAEYMLQRFATVGYEANAFPISDHIRG